MNIKKLKFAFTKYGLCSIELATKEFDYFLDNNLKIELTYCKGEKILPYWRKKQNINLYLLANYFKGESLEHYNAKMNIVYSKEFLFKTNNESTLFKGFYSKAEYKCLEIKKIIDVVLLDENNLPIIGIEIHNTNKKKYKDIIEFYKLNYPIYEYNINDQTIEILHNGDNSIETFKLRERISNGNKELQKISKRINLLEKGFNRLNKKVKKCWSDYYREEEEDEGLYNIRRVEEKVRITEHEIEQLEYNISKEKGLQRKIKELIDLKKRLSNNPTLTNLFQ
tara:strand:- start:50 stop:892 length:843 start_codon:yes stop_codon:yes gene_type:complete